MTKDERLRNRFNVQLSTFNVLLINVQPVSISVGAMPTFIPAAFPSQQMIKLGHYDFTFFDVVVEIFHHQLVLAGKGMMLS